MTHEVEKKIGLDFEKLKVASIVQQGELNAIINAKPKEFKEWIQSPCTWNGAANGKQRRHSRLPIASPMAKAKDNASCFFISSSSSTRAASSITNASVHIKRERFLFPLQKCSHIYAHSGNATQGKKQYILESSSTSSSAAAST